MLGEYHEAVGNMNEQQLKDSWWMLAGEAPVASLRDLHELIGEGRPCVLNGEGRPCVLNGRVGHVC